MTEYKGFADFVSCFTSGNCTHGRDDRSVVRLRNKPVAVVLETCHYGLYCVLLSVDSVGSDDVGPWAWPLGSLTKCTGCDWTACNASHVTGNSGVLGPWGAV